MIPLSQAQIKRMTAVHGWAGVVLGLLLYAVVATGAVAVFAPEIGRWSVGGVRDAPPLDGPIDAKVRRLAKLVDPAYRDIGIWSGEGTDLHVLSHPCDEPRVRPRGGFRHDIPRRRRDGRGAGTARRLHLATAAGLGDSAQRNFLSTCTSSSTVPNPWV